MVFVEQASCLSQSIHRAHRVRGVYCPFVVYGVFGCVGLIARPLLLLSLARVGAAASPFGAVFLQNCTRTRRLPFCCHGSVPSLSFLLTAVVSLGNVVGCLGRSGLKNRQTKKKLHFSPGSWREGEAGRRLPCHTLFNCSSPQCLHVERSHTNRMLQH